MAGETSNGTRPGGTLPLPTGPLPVPSQHRELLRCAEPHQPRTHQVGGVDTLLLPLRVSIVQSITCPAPRPACAAGSKTTDTFSRPRSLQARQPSISRPTRDGTRPATPTPHRPPRVRTASCAPGAPPRAAAPPARCAPARRPTHTRNLHGHILPVHFDLHDLYLLKSNNRPSQGGCPTIRPPHTARDGRTPAPAGPVPATPRPAARAM